MLTDEYFMIHLILMIRACFLLVRPISSDILMHSFITLILSDGKIKVATTPNTKNLKRCAAYIFSNLHIIKMFDFIS